MKDVVSLDVGSCAVVKPLEQMINFIKGIDKRLKNLKPENFLQIMVEIATDEAVLLSMHQGLQAICEQDHNEKDKQFQYNLL